MLRILRAGLNYLFVWFFPTSFFYALVVYVESAVCNRSAAPFSFESLRIGCKRGDSGELSLHIATVFC